MTVFRLKKDLERAWNEAYVPEFHRIIILKSITSLQPYIAAPILARELEDTVKSKAPILQTLKAVIAREESLNSLQAMSEYFGKL